MNWKMAWGLDRRVTQPADASATKVFGTEFAIEAYRLLMESLGPSADLATDSPGALLRGPHRAHATGPP